MRPLQFVEGGVRSDVTLDVQVVALFDVVTVDVAAESDPHFGRVYGTVSRFTSRVNICILVSGTYIERPT